MPSLKLPNGESAEAEPVEFLVENDPIAQIRTINGDKLTMKIQVDGVFRVLGRFDPTGQPLYFIKSRNILVVRCDPKLSRRSMSEEDSRP